MHRGACSGCSGKSEKIKAFDPVRQASVELASSTDLSHSMSTSFDVVVSPVSGVVPFASEGLWQHAYLRFGVQAGYSWPTTTVGSKFFRGGGHAGIGYEWDVAQGVALRLFDLRFVSEVTGNDADRLGHAYDLGVTLSSGLVFK